MQKPTISRIVHFNGDGGPEAALIVAVHNDELINLVSWNSGGTAQTRTSVKLGEGPGTWNWPPRS